MSGMMRVIAGSGRRPTSSSGGVPHTYRYYFFRANESDSPSYWSVSEIEMRNAGVRVSPVSVSSTGIIMFGHTAGLPADVIDQNTATYNTIAAAYGAGWVLDFGTPTLTDGYRWCSSGQLNANPKGWGVYGSDSWDGGTSCFGWPSLDESGPQPIPLAGQIWFGPYSFSA